MQTASGQIAESETITMHEQAEGQHPLEHTEFPVRVSIETVAKGALRPKFSFAYRSNEHAIAYTRYNYLSELREQMIAAQIAGQEIEGNPTLPTPNDL